MQTSKPTSSTPATIPPTTTNTQILPFTVEVAQQDYLPLVASFRAAAYGKHMPTLARRLSQPEAADYEFGCEVWVARSKLDGSLLGTLRTHANVHKPLPLQASMSLPIRFRQARMVEATRLCVQGSPNASLVRSALFKALHQYCVTHHVDWIVAAGRRPIDRIYDSLLFADVERPGALYPMAHADHVLHRVMCLSPNHAYAMWSASHHPLYPFMVDTYHPDIHLERMANLDFDWLCPQGESTVRFRDETALPLNAANAPVTRAVEMVG